MKYQFRAILDQDLLLNHSGLGYNAADPHEAWHQLAQVLAPQTVDHLQTRYTIEEMPQDGKR